MPNKQEITLTLDGKSGFLPPESVATAIENLVEILKSVDSRMWNVQSPRYRWRTASASMASPFRITFQASLILPDSPDADVVSGVMTGFRELDRKSSATMPKYFSEDDLCRAKLIVGLYHDGVSTLSVEAPGRATISPSTRVADNADLLARSKKTNYYESYGSIEGILRRVTVDDRENHQLSEIQIIDRVSDSLVECRLNPMNAAALAPHIRKRVVLFGNIRRRADDLPVRIDVESHQVIDDGGFPTIDDIHRLGIKIRGKKDAADFVDELRGNGG